MKLRRIMTGAMAGAMALSLSVSAFAAGEQETTLNLDGATATATIKVELPATPGKMVLNPYGLKVTAGTGKDASGDVTSQIAAKDQYLKNLSDTDIKVGFSATATPTSGVTLATAPVVNEGTKAETKKSVFMYYEVAAVDADDAKPDAWTVYNAADKDIKNKVTVLSNKATVSPITVSLAKSDDGSTVASEKGYAVIHLDGNAASSPTTAWAAEDTVAVNFTFTFTPTVMPVASAG